MGKGGVRGRGREADPTFPFFSLKQQKKLFLDNEGQEFKDHDPRSNCLKPIEVQLAATIFQFEAVK